MKGNCIPKIIKKFKRTPKINLRRLRIGGKTVDVPVIIINGSIKGKTLLITAGMDGDEYSGISASYNLIDKYCGGLNAGKLIIIPIVNLPGFWNETSLNPLDGKYPKFIYPGSETGKESEQLVYWLHTNWVREADVWLDLHGGSNTERLTPFVITWKSKNTEVNDFARMILNTMPAGKVVFDQDRISDKTDILGRNGCSYFISEAGSFTYIDRPSIDFHKKVAEHIMSNVGMLNNRNRRSRSRVFSSVNEYALTRGGLWHARKFLGSVKKGMVLGEVLSFDNKIIEQVLVRKTGQLLWIKEGMAAHPGDIIGGVAV